MGKGIFDKITEKNFLTLKIILFISALFYSFLAIMPKHSDFWLLNYFAKMFATYGYGVTSYSQIPYPSSYVILQGIWIKLGSILLNIDLNSWTTVIPEANRDILQAWCMVSNLVFIFLFVIFSYYYLKNKWLSVICFGTLTFVSIIIMGQTDIFCVFFIYLSLVSILKSIDNKKYMRYLLAGMILLGVSIEIAPFGGLLLPLYVIFTALSFYVNNRNLVDTCIFMVVSMLLFAIASTLLWLPYITSFFQYASTGESSFLLNLQLAPLYLPPNHNISIWLLGYIIILYMFISDIRKTPTNVYQNKRYFIYYSFVIMAWMFISVYTHPQWWIILLPFILLILDEFKDRINYIFTLVLMSLFIFYPMMWVNNIDGYLEYYFPTFGLTGQILTIFSTMIIGLLVLWIIDLKRSLQVNGLDITDARQTSKRCWINERIDSIFPLLILLVPFIIIFILGYACLILIGYDIQGGIVTTQPVGAIYGNNIAGQSFISQYNNLNSVEIYMATYTKIPTKDIIFHLKSMPNSEDIVTERVEGSKISDNTYYRFKFPAISDSMGKEYYFSVESPDATQNDAVTIWYGTDNYKDGSAYYNNQIINGDLAFRTHYNSRISDVISFIRNKYPEIYVGN